MINKQKTKMWPHFPMRMPTHNDIWNWTFDLNHAQNEIASFLFVYVSFSFLSTTAYPHTQPSASAVSLCSLFCLDWCGLFHMYWHFKNYQIIHFLFAVVHFSFHRSFISCPIEHVAIFKQHSSSFRIFDFNIVLVFRLRRINREKCGK